MVTEATIPEGYKKTELGVSPEDWKVTSLAGLVTIQHGFGFQSQYFKSFGEYRLTTPGHFHETGGFRNVGNKQKFYDGPFPDGYLLSEGDLIVAMTEQADGLLGSAALVPVGGIYLHNQRLGKVKVLSPEVSSGFLFRIFNFKAYRAKVCETAVGTKVKHTSPSKLLGILIALPPTKAEQEAIATVISDTDELIASLDKLITKKRNIKQGTMQQLLTGKKRLPGFTGKWEAKKLGEIANITMGQSPRSVFYNTKGIGLPLIQGNADIDNRKTISRIFTSTITRKGQNGNIIMSVRAPVGEIARATFDCCLGRGVCAIAYDNDFLYHLLIYLEKGWVRLSKGSTFDSINSREVKELELFVPLSDEEQTTIAQVLSDMDAEIETLEQQLNKYKAIKQGMMQELLTGKTRLI